MGGFNGQNVTWLSINQWPMPSSGILEFLGSCFVSYIVHFLTFLSRYECETKDISTSGSLIGLPCVKLLKLPLIHLNEDNCNLFVRKICIGLRLLTAPWLHSCLPFRHQTWRRSKNSPCSLMDLRLECGFLSGQLWKLGWFLTEIERFWVCSGRKVWHYCLTVMPDLWYSNIRLFEQLWNMAMFTGCSVWNKIIAFTRKIIHSFEVHK